MALVPLCLQFLPSAHFTSTTGFLLILQTCQGYFYLRAFALGTHAVQNALPSVIPVFLLFFQTFSISRLCMISSLIFLLKCTALPALPIPLSCFIFFHSAYHILTQSICFVFCLHSHISTLGQGLLLLLFLLFLFCSLLSWST